MAGFKRIMLFLVVNFLVLTTMTIVLRLLGVEPYLMEYGLNYTSLGIFCLFWGISCSIVSLWMSRAVAKWSMKVQLIDASSPQRELKDLVFTVHELAKKAGLKTMPEVGYYVSDEVNAFATGPTRNRALVAVSTGLLNTMDREELEGVLAHEVAHIANGDMVTSALLQGIVNAFVMFLARVVAYAITRGGDRQSSNGLAYFLVVLVMQTVFMFLGSMVIAWFSRKREFKADEGGARLSRKDNMVAALAKLRRTVDRADDGRQPALATLKISGKSKEGLMSKLFSTHPPLEERIKRLQSS